MSGFLPLFDEPEAPAAAPEPAPGVPEWHRRYLAYQAETHARGEVCRNVSDWRRDQEL